jgi:hypothetical protein
MLWTLKLQLEIGMMSERQRRKSPLRKYQTLYRKPGKNLEDISGHAALTIILRHAFAKAVLPILEVWGCSAPGEKARKREKKKIAYVNHANFSENYNM